jgi:hypothetical protein
MCPTVWCPTRRIRDTRGGLDVSGDLDLGLPEAPYTFLRNFVTCKTLIHCYKDPKPLLKKI